jgi:hypothetical protein
MGMQVTSPGPSDQTLAGSSPNGGQGLPVFASSLKPPKPVLVPGNVVSSPRAEKRLERAETAYVPPVGKSYFRPEERVSSQDKHSMSARLPSRGNPPPASPIDSRRRPSREEFRRAFSRAFEQKYAYKITKKEDGRITYHFDVDGSVFRRPGNWFKRKYGGTECPSPKQMAQYDSYNPGPKIITLYPNKRNV